MTEWFDTSGVVQNILGHCNGREIQNLSLVNTKWNREARNLLKIRGRTVAIIGHRDRTQDHPSNSIPGRSKSYACEDLLRFADMIQSMENDTIYSGLKISAKVSHFDHYCPPIYESTILSIAARVPIKLLAMRIHRIPAYDRQTQKEVQNLGETECKAVKPLHLFLTQACHQLARFDLIGWDSVSHPDFTASTSGGFGDLEIFKFSVTYHQGRPNADDRTFISKIVKTAPNLKEFYAEERAGKLKWLKTLNRILADSSAVLVINKFDVGIAKLYSSRLAQKDRTFWVTECCRNPADYEAMRAVLRKSRKILEKLKLPSALLAEMLLDGVPFVSLRDLDVNINLSFLRDVHPNLLEIIFGGACWSRCFPDLQHLAIYATSEDKYPKFMEQIVHEIIGRRLVDQDEEPARTKCTNLQTLYLSGALEPKEMEFLANFHVRHLRSYDFDQSYPWLLHGLEKLEELSFSIAPEPTPCTDAIFCGVYPEEADELMEQDCEYLKSVHIVPVHPPITWLSSIRKLSMFAIGSDQDCDNDLLEMLEDLQELNLTVYVR